MRIGYQIEKYFEVAMKLARDDSSREQQAINGGNTITK
jgi:hypothetical protein